MTITASGSIVLVMAALFARNTVVAVNIRSGSAVYADAHT